MTTDRRDQQNFWEEVCQDQLDGNPLYWLQVADDIAPDEVLQLQLAMALSAEAPYEEPAPLPDGVDRQRLHRVLVNAMKAMDASDDMKQELRSMLGKTGIETTFRDELFQIRLLSDQIFSDIARLRLLALARRLPDLATEDRELFSDATASIMSRMKPFDRQSERPEDESGSGSLDRLSRLVSGLTGRSERASDSDLEASAVFLATGYLRGLSLGISPRQGVQLEKARISGEPDQQELLREFRAGREERSDEEP